MVKVTIEATGRKTEVLTGEMVNAAVIEKDKCAIVNVSSSKDGVGARNFVKSLVNLVNHSIEAYALDKMSDALLHMLFSIEMRNYAEKRLSDAKEAKKSGEDVANDFIEILRKAVEE